MASCESVGLWACGASAHPSCPYPRPYHSPCIAGLQRTEVMMRAPVVGGFSHRACAKFVSWERTRSRSWLLSATTTRVPTPSSAAIGQTACLRAPTVPRWYPQSLPPALQRGGLDDRALRPASPRRPHPGPKQSAQALLAEKSSCK